MKKPKSLKISELFQNRMYELGEILSKLFLSETEKMVSPPLVVKGKLIKTRFNKFRRGRIFKVQSKQKAKNGNASKK